MADKFVNEECARVIAEEVKKRYEKPVAGIPATDLAGSIPKEKLDSNVQASLERADSALQSHQSLTDYAKKEDVPRPTYYKLNGQAMTDVGGVGTKYPIAISNLTPQSPAPQVGDTVVFDTDSYTYIGTVTEKQMSAIIVEVKVTMLGNAENLYIGTFDFDIETDVNLEAFSSFSSSGGSVPIQVLTETGQAKLRSYLDTEYTDDFVRPLYVLRLIQSGTIQAQSVGEVRSVTITAQSQTDTGYGPDGELYLLSAEAGFPVRWIIDGKNKILLLYRGAKESSGGGSSGEGGGSSTELLEITLADSDFKSVSKDFKTGSYGGTLTDDAAKRIASQITGAGVPSTISVTFNGQKTILQGKVSPVYETIMGYVYSSTGPITIGFPYIGFCYLTIIASDSLNSASYSILPLWTPAENKPITVSGGKGGEYGFYDPMTIFDDTLKLRIKSPDDALNHNVGLLFDFDGVSDSDKGGTITQNIKGKGAGTNGNLTNFKYGFINNKTSHVASEQLLVELKDDGVYIGGKKLAFAEDIPTGGGGSETQYYDVVISSQEEFTEFLHAMSSRDDWHSALILSGTYEVYDESIVFPQHLYTIKGLGKVEIIVSAFDWYNQRDNGVISWESNALEDMSARAIENITVCIEDTDKILLYVFGGCNNLKHCYVEFREMDMDNKQRTGFKDCSNLTDCDVKTINTIGVPTGYEDCLNLTNCSFSADGGVVHGYLKCHNLVNCSATLDDFHYIDKTENLSFSMCEHLVLCSCNVYDDIAVRGFDNCIDLIGCHGSVTSNIGDKILFNNCDKCSNCDSDDEDLQEVFVSCTNVDPNTCPKYEEY